MKRFRSDVIWLFATCLTGIGIILFGSIHAWASGGRKEFQVMPQFRDEGDILTPFNVFCSTWQWNVVIASNPVSRSRVLYAPLTNVASVCISTDTPYISTNVTGSARKCDDFTPGVELSSGSALTDYSSVRITCKSRVATSSSVIKGWEMSDKGDRGGLPQ